MTKSIFEQLGGAYEQQGDYLLPYLTVPTEEEQPIYCSQFPAGEWACACIMPWLYVQNGLVYERCRCILGSSR